MNVAKKQKISDAARATFQRGGLDYDAWQPGVVPLFALISEFPLNVTELTGCNRRLTARRAVNEISRKAQIDLPEADNPDAALSGFLYAYQFADCLDAWMFTEKAEPTVRRRYSAAHEFGHYLLHFTPLLEQYAGSDFLILTEGVYFGEAADNTEPAAQIKAVQDFDAQEPLALPDLWEMEEEANQFAAELLLPRNACLNAAEVYARKLGARRAVIAHRLASEFFVSFAAMHRRLTDLEFFRVADKN